MLVSKLAAAKSLETVNAQDVFKTVLYTGNGSTQAINTGFNIKDDGGLVWLKNRQDTITHCLQDTKRGPTKQLYTTKTGPEQTRTTGVASFDTSGFTLDNGSEPVNLTNTAGKSYVSWSFKKHLKFFDIIQYTGDGQLGRTVAHNLGSVPGCIIIKSTNSTSNWAVYHVSVGNLFACFLNTDETAASGSYWNNTYPSSTEFTLGDNSAVNANGVSYVAYLFANGSGGFGGTGNEDIIKCGFYYGNGSTNGPTIDLGFEPQWILLKGASVVSPWIISDRVRTFAYTLSPNTTDVEQTPSPAWVSTSSTGFQVTSSSSTYNNPGSLYIYVAIAKES